MTKAVTDADFNAQVLEAGKPVLVDFWAEWCGPCRMIAPALEELDAELDGVEIVKVNIDDNPEAPGRYGVMSIPTMILFKDGKPVATQVGAKPKGDLKACLVGALG